jgi:hypothetical protein
MTPSVTPWRQAQSSTAGQALATCSAWLRRHAWLALPLLGLPLYRLYWQLGLPKGADTLMHMMRAALLDVHIRQGDLYPRWLPELMLGHGYPVLGYYAPLTYYLVELWRLLGLTMVQAFVATPVLLILLAGLGTYRLAQDVFGDRGPAPSLVAATAYMYAPYLLTNTLVRGALPEITAQALLPWIFWSLRRLICSGQPQRYVLALALTLAALAVSHNITLLFAPPALLAYGTVLIWRLPRRRLRVSAWAALGLSAAVGLSAFLWFPLLAERKYLVDTAYKISQEFLLAENAWTWRNFLDLALVYQYTFAVPFQLGLVQLILALAGAVLARRRDGEWLFFVALALICGLGIGAWTLPVWLNSSVLQVAQFPWRLLSVLSLPMALLTGGCVAHMGSRAWRSVATAALLAVILFANSPRLDFMHVLWGGQAHFNPALTAQLEVENGSLGASSLQEFRPRWVQDALEFRPDASLTAGQLEITPLAGSAGTLRARVTAAGDSPLRFNMYYFPGWRVTLDGATALRTYPTTDLGLLTVDLSAGTHEVEVTWVGTPLQRAAGWLTLLTLAGLTAFCLAQRGRRAWANLPALLLVTGLAVAFSRSAPEAYVAPAQSFAAGGAQLTGYQVQSQANGDIYVYPSWYVAQTPPEGWRLRWALSDGAGQVVAETVAQPYFNTSRARNWPPGTLVRDAYRLAPAPGTPAGVYELTVAEVAADGSRGAAAHVGTVTSIQAVPAEDSPPRPMQVRVGDESQLVGFDVAAPKAKINLTDRLSAVVESGQDLAYTLYWQANFPEARNYHGFLHLVDRAGQPIVQQDQLPGPSFRPPLLWDRFHVQPDRYLLHIPAGTPSGLYWPSAGLYNFQARERLPAFDANGQELADGARLPPVKVLGNTMSGPKHALVAEFGDVAALAGYDLQPGAAGVRPGTPLTLTLYYRSKQLTPVDYTRFVHLTGPTGQVAGADSLPQDGANPTWAWVPGEVVIDPARLDIPPDAEPGIYTLSMGLYNRAAQGERLAVTDQQGRPLPNNEVILGHVQIVR